MQANLITVEIIYIYDIINALNLKSVVGEFLCYLILK